MKKETKESILAIVVYALMCCFCPVIFCAEGYWFWAMVIVFIEIVATGIYFKCEDVRKFFDMGGE